MLLNLFIGFTNPVLLFLIIPASAPTGHLHKGVF